MSVPLQWLSISPANAGASLYHHRQKLQICCSLQFLTSDALSPGRTSPGHFYSKSQQLRRQFCDYHRSLHPNPIFSGSDSLRRCILADQLLPILLLLLLLSNQQSLSFRLKGVILSQRIKFYSVSASVSGFQSIRFYCPGMR